MALALGDRGLQSAAESALAPKGPGEAVCRAMGVRGHFPTAAPAGSSPSGLVGTLLLHPVASASSPQARLCLPGLLVLPRKEEEVGLGLQVWATQPALLLSHQLLEG